MSLSLKRRILLGFGIIMTMTVVSTAVDVALLSGVGTDVDGFRAALDRKSQAVDIDLVMQKVRVRVNQWLRSMNPTFAQQANDLLASDVALVAQATKSVRTDAEKKIVTDIDHALTAYIESWRVIQGLYAQEAEIYSQRLLAPSSQIRADLAKIRDRDTLEPRLARLVGEARDGFTGAEASVFRFRGSMQQDDANQATAAIAASLSALDRAGAGEGADAASIKRVAVTIAAWRGAFADAVQVAQVRVARLGSWTTKEGEAMAVGASALRSEGEAAAAAAQSNVVSTVARCIWTLYLLSGLIVLLGGGLSLILARSISSPLMRMAGVLKMLAAGERTVEIPETDRRDEIGEMARAAKVFKDQSIEKVLIEENVAAARHKADEDRNRAEAIRAELQSHQYAAVTALAFGLDRMSKGDLTGRLDQSFTQEYEKLRTDFNATVTSLESAMSLIAKATGAIDSGTEEIAHASDDLSRRTEQQAASLEETAAALNVITVTVKKMATNAGEAAQVVGFVLADAKTSGEIVGRTTEAMDRIQGSSNKISQIIGVIDEIAFQTNLLALNAGVEAARAGDAGRGFAVVASEVRGLAQRSAEAAKEIKTLISESSGHVGDGVVLVSKTGESLRSIIEKVSAMDALVRQISAASQDQASSLAEVNIAITQMDQVVQQNAAMVEEATAAAHALKGETRDLTTMVDRFQVSVDDGRTNPVRAMQAKVARYAGR